MARYTKTGTPNTIGELNSQLDLIAVAIADTLSRKGDIPNQMENSLDMNSNQIINLAYPASPSAPLRLRDLEGSGFVEPIIPPTYFNIKDYGAREEYTAAVNKIAIDLAIVALSAAGGVLWVPRGTFFTTGGHTIVGNMHIKGEGMFISRLKIPSDNTSDSLFVKPSPETIINNFIISDITLEGSWDAARREGSGSLVSGRNIRNVSIHNAEFLNGRFFGLNLNLCTEANITNNRFTNICRDACGVWNTPNIIVSGNIFKGNDDDCISLNSAGFAPLNGVVKSRIIVSHNILEDVGGIKVQSANTVIIENNIITRNKGNGCIHVSAENSTGFYQSNPQTVLVAGNIITDIIDRFLATEIAPSINARIGIKIESVLGTETLDFNNYYTTSGAAGTDTIRKASGIVIQDNYIRRTLPPVTNYSDWGFGGIFTRFSTDTFAPTGFADPEILESYMRVRPVEIKGPVSRLEFKGNTIDHTATDCIDFILGTGQTAANFDCNEMVFSGNIFRNARSRGIDLAIYDGTEQDILMENNIFDLDPLMDGTNRQADGSWANGTDCVAIQATDVKGVKILRNTFKNCSAPYLQGSVTAFIVKYGNAFIGEPFAGVTVGAFSASSKGVGIYPNEILEPSSNLIYVNSDPQSGTYGEMFSQPVRRVAGPSAPSTGFYFLGEFLPANGGVTSGGETEMGYRRLTTGAGNVLNTDWEVLKANV
jgi:hypothetical protein